MLAHTTHSASWNSRMPLCFESFPSLLVLSVGIKGSNGRMWDCLSLKHETFNSKRFIGNLCCYSLALKFSFYVQLTLYHTGFSTGANEFQQRFRRKHPPVHTCSTYSTQAYHTDHYLPLNRLLCTPLTASSVMFFYHWESYRNCMDLRYHPPTLKKSCL